MLGARFRVRRRTPRVWKGKMGRKYAKAWSDTFHGCPVSLEARGLFDVMREAAAQSYTGAPVVRWEAIAMHGHASRLRRLLAELVEAELVELPEGCAILEHETKRGRVVELCRVDDEGTPKSARSPTSVRLAIRVSPTTQEDTALRRAQGAERVRKHRTSKKQLVLSNNSHAKNAYGNGAVTHHRFRSDQPLTPSQAVGLAAARPEDRGRAASLDEDTPTDGTPREPATPTQGVGVLSLEGEGSMVDPFAERSPPSRGAGPLSVENDFAAMALAALRAVGQM